MLFEEWIQLGNRVKETRNILMDEILKYNKTSFEGRRIEQALNYLDKVRDKLDDVVCQQFPDELTATLVFYGPIREEKKTEPEAES